MKKFIFSIFVILLGSSVTFQILAVTIYSFDNLKLALKFARLGYFVPVYLNIFLGMILVIFVIIALINDNRLPFSRIKIFGF